MRPFPFTIGADPELNLISQGRKVDCAYTMKNLLGNDSNFHRDKGLIIEGAGNIGWDGCSSTCELRPDPATTPKQLTQNIGTLFQEFYKRINLFDMSTLSFHSSVGGHIHLLLPDRKLTTPMIKSWHRTMASFYIPIMMGENKINLELRAKGSYGKINDFHTNNEFTNEDGKRCLTYEFRVPSAEWITHPKICESVIAYIATVWNEITNHPKNALKNKDFVYKTEKQGEALQMLLVSEYSSLTKDIFKNINKTIKTFEYYNDYKEQIDYILNPERVIADKKKFNYNIIEGWSLEKKSVTTKRDILNVKKFSEKALEKNLDNESHLINISYNSDPNCEIFAQTLAQRSVAFNWKLKKTYFLFGLRKGVGKLFAFNLNKEPIEGKDIVQTTEDYESACQLMEKMNSRYNTNSRGKSPIRFDFNTGEIIQEKDSTVIIGIPYEMRMKQDTKEFLSLVYDIETDTKKAVKHDKWETSIDDNNFEADRKGKFWKIMNGYEGGDTLITIADTSTAQKNVIALTDEIVAAQEEETQSNCKSPNGHGDPELTFTPEQLARFRNRLYNMLPSLDLDLGQFNQ